MGLLLPRRPVVLLVEDELLLRMDAAAMVAEAGFEVVEAGDADEAIAILESRRDIGIVFTDIQMPGSMDGLKQPARSAAAGHRSRSSRHQALWMSGKRFARGWTVFAETIPRETSCQGCCNSPSDSTTRMSLRGARDRSARSHPGMTIMKAAATLYAMISGVI